jgi:hypothetical protein
VRGVPPRRLRRVRCTLLGAPGADAIDDRLHAERLDAATGERRLHEQPLETLPDGAFVLLDGSPFLVRGAELLRWTPAGYAERRARPVRAQVRTITPPSLLALLRTERRPLVPFLHPSAEP